MLQATATVAPVTPEIAPVVDLFEFATCVEVHVVETHDELPTTLVLPAAQLEQLLELALDEKVPAVQYEQEEFPLPEA